MLDADPQSWPCAICDNTARTRVHPGCRQRIRDNLAELPALYRQLEGALYPGRSGGDGRSATRTAPLPCSLDALDLRARGGIEGVLASWAADLCEREGWDLPAYGTVETAVEGYSGLLLLNLTLLCDEHPAIREIADEVRATVGQARRLIDGERPPRRVHVICPCGQQLGFTLDTLGLRCPNCQTQHGHAELLDLPLAERRAAA
jgi:hypothetical protein